MLICTLKVYNDNVPKYAIKNSHKQMEVENAKRHLVSLPL
jgi:hypothetical protein